MIRSLHFSRAMLMAQLVFFCLFGGAGALQGQVIFEDNFNTGALKPQWIPRPNLSGANGVVQVFADQGINGTGDYALGLGKLVNSPNDVVNALDLPLNLQGRPNVELTFAIRDVYDETNVEDGLYFSDNNGISFVKVLNFHPNDWCEQYGRLPAIQVSKLAQKFNLNPVSAQFVIRFQQRGVQTLNNFSSSDGIYLDEVRVYVPNLVYAQVQPGQDFFDDFETGTAKNSWARRFADSTATITPGGPINRPSGFASVLSGFGAQGSTYGLVLGKTCADGSSTQVVDLHLNLQGLSQAEMTLWIGDIYDETQVDDAVFLSDDGGETFHKVFELLPGSWCNLECGQFPPFDLDALAAQVGIGLSDKFIVRFQHRGQQPFNNFSSSDGIYLDYVRVYVPDLVYATLPFQEDFELGILRNMWSRRFSDSTATITTSEPINQPSGFANVLSGFGAQGSTYGLVLGKTCADGSSTQVVDLHLNLQGLSQVEMTLWVGDIYDETQVDDAIFLSDDGGETFHKVFEFMPGSWCNLEYGQFPPFDLDALAAQVGIGLSDKFIVRFQHRGQQPFDNFSSSDGIYLDNVRVYVPDLVYATLPFQEDFELGILRNMWSRRFADSTATITTSEPINQPSGFANVLSGFGAQGSTYGLVLGKTCADGSSTQVLDLHLNLQGLSQVEMSIWMGDIYDETQVDDAIFLSDDGGETFHKVFEFMPGSWCSLEYGQFPPFDLDALAAQVGIGLSDKFIVRFQHQGQQPFDNFSSSDGIYLDNVRVYVPNLAYTTLPFEEDFELGILRNMWSQRFPDSTATISTGEPWSRPSSLVEVIQNEGRAPSTFALGLGKRCADGFGANAADLHLNLKDQTNVVMTYWLRNRYDQTQVDDAIFFSNDGGNTFHRAFSLDMDSYPNNQYTSMPPLNISEIAAAMSPPLALTDSFIVRFQQYGQQAINNFSNSDGFYLDDLSITGNNTISIAPESFSTLELFPNPSTGRFLVRGETTSARTLRVRVFNSLGQEVIPASEVVFATQWNLGIDLSSQPDGIYSLRVEDGQNSMSRALLLAR